MDKRPLRLARDRKRSFLSVLPYLIAGYVLLIGVIVLLASWSHRF